MLPKKAESFIPNVAKRVGLPEAVIEAVIDVYYKKTRSLLTNAEEPILCLETFCMFKAKPKVIPVLIMKYQNQLLSIGTPKTERKRLIKKEIQKRYENILKIQRKIKTINKKKYEFYNPKAQE